MQNLSILTQFFSKNISAHHFCFESCLANLLGNKITIFYQKHWLLIFKMVAQRCDWWWKFSIFIRLFTFSNNYPKILFCFLAVIRGINNFHEKKLCDVVAFLRNIAREWPLNSKNLTQSLSSMQQHLPIHFSANFVRKCCILAHN